MNNYSVNSDNTIIKFLKLINEISREILHESEENIHMNLVKRYITYSLI